MHITTFNESDTDKLLELAEAKTTVIKIRLILKNRHNAHDQVKAIKKLLEGEN